jgi:AraC-like DNA-binding protein
MFMSVAAIKWQMVISVQNGTTIVTLRGPETSAKPAPCPENAEFFGINFKLGAFMPHLPTVDLVDAEVHLPEGAGKSFWFNSSVWELPNFDNADTFIKRLVRDELLVDEPLVDATLQGHVPYLSVRSVQRRFLRATGLTHGALSQIERAQQAVALLEQGVSILDTVDRVGYADQPHLTRSLKKFYGRTPAQILRPELASGLLDAVTSDMGNG